MDKLGEKVKNDIQLLNTWDITVQMYCVLKIYLDIGKLLLKIIKQKNQLGHEQLILKIKTYGYIEERIG